MTAPPVLAPYVRCIWTLKGDHSGGPERILPDGSFELVFHLGRPFRSDGSSQPAAMLIGEVRRPVLVEPDGHVDVIGVRFHAGGAASFFDFPMHEARDAMIPLNDITSVLPEIADPSAIASFLQRRIASRRHQRMVTAALAEIRQMGGDLRVRDLAERFGTTERTLERSFTEIVGLGPKQFCRLTRFRNALRSDDSLAYYDQSHRIHEFREFAGVTPTEFRRERNAINDAFVGNLQDEAASLD